MSVAVWLALRARAILLWLCILLCAAVNELLYQMSKPVLSLAAEVERAKREFDEEYPWNWPEGVPGECVCLTIPSRSMNVNPTSPTILFSYSNLNEACRTPQVSLTSYIGMAVPRLARNVLGLDRRIYRNHNSHSCMSTGSLLLARLAVTPRRCARCCQDGIHGRTSQHRHPTILRHHYRASSIPFQHLNTGDKSAPLRGAGDGSLAPARVNQDGLQ